MLTQKQVIELFVYKDGCLYWRERKKGRRMDRPAGTKHDGGYTRINITQDNTPALYYAHRLIYLYHFGYMPIQVDHIDGDTSNNHIENLREASQLQNTWNTKGHRDSVSGIKNVAWSERRKRWTVRVSRLGKTIYREFEDLELAELVAIELREKMHGPFARHI